MDTSAGHQVTCAQRFVSLPRDCGHLQNVPIRCGDLFCNSCEREWRAEAVERWLSAFLAMKKPRMLTLTIKSGFDIGERERFENASFRRFLDLRLGPRNWARFYQEALDYLNPGDSRYDTTVKQLQRLKVSLNNYRHSHGKWPRVRELLARGISGRDLTWSDDFGYHLHRHIIFDGWFVPHSLWCVLWCAATQGQGLVVHICKRDSSRKDLEEAISYLGKVSDIPQERQAEVRQAFFNVKRIWRIGDIKPVEPAPSVCPFCGDPACRVSGPPLIGDVLQRDPDGVIVRFGQAIYTKLRKEKGQWVEVWRVDGLSTLNLIPQELTCHSSPARAGPGPPLFDPGGQYV